MGKRFIITESEKNEIRKMYGLLKEQISEPPICNQGGCKGKYTGPEFNSQGDIAHQYSNVMHKAVAEKLKELYTQGIYSKVDLNNIKLSTKGMGSGNVVYIVDIPFIQVSDKCDAMTGFNHVGGWGHPPALNARKKELLNYIPPNKNENVILNDELFISPLTQTPEGLQEYWIQWRHRDYQSDCVTKPKIDNSRPQAQQLKISSKDKVGSEVIPIQSDNLLGLRNDLKEKTQNISIDVDSVETDFKQNNYVVSFKLGNTKIKNLSLLFDNVSQKSMEDRFKDLQMKYNLRSISSGDILGEDGSKRWYVLSYIPAE